MVEWHLDPTADDLQQQEFFTMEEAADLLMLDLDVVQHAVIVGKLPAELVGDDVAIHREHMLTWFLQRVDRSQAG